MIPILDSRGKGNSSDGRMNDGEHGGQNEHSMHGNNSTVKPNERNHCRI